MSWRQVVAVSTVSLPFLISLTACSASDSTYSACRDAVLGRYDDPTATIIEDQVYRFGEGEIMSKDDFYSIAASMLTVEYTVTIWNIKDFLSVPPEWWNAQIESITPGVQDSIASRAPAGATDPEYVEIVVAGPNGDRSVIADDWFCVDYGDTAELIAKRNMLDSSQDEVANFIRDAIYSDYVSNAEWAAGGGGGRD